MNGKTILLIDDDELLCDMMRTLLELEGYAVAVAHDGAAGFAALEAAACDLIVLDLVMPQMDGLRFLSLLPERVENPPPVVVISASLADDVIHRARQFDTAGLVRKPVDPIVLRDTIAAALAGG